MKVRHDDGTVHFSDLKQFALSPAHYVHSCTQKWVSTRPMRVGSIAHHIVLGPHKKRPIVLYEGGDRRGKDWLSFEAAHVGSEIVTLSEWGDAEATAMAVKADPVALSILNGAQYELPAAWEMDGFDCSTDGIDIVGPGYIAELKVTNSAEPDAWMRHATRMLYHAQMAFYSEGARANGADVKECYIIGVEDSPPYPVTVLRLTPATLDAGRKSCAMWLERLRACEAAAAFPGYAQAPIDFVLPEWMTGGEE